MSFRKKSVGYLATLCYTLLFVVSSLRNTIVSLFTFIFLNMNIVWTSFSILYLWCQKSRSLFSLASFAHSYWKNWNLLSHFHYSLEYWKKIMCMNDNKSKPNWELLIFSFILLQSIQLSEGIKLMIFFFFNWLNWILN